MKKLLTLFLLCNSIIVAAQSNPAITRLLQNTSVTARHYVSGNSTAINDASLVNVQSVKYSANFVYATTTGLPSYVTGPYLDGNPNLAGNQNAIFKFPLNPVQNTGTATATTGGNIGVFINGVALFDYRDGVSWQNSTQTLKGGPLGGTGDGVWNRDAVVGERGGFDCAKGHPAGTNYHHHQNPSAFNLDLSVISTVCNLYNADGLYPINSSQHSPLLGFAYDGFPIYGAYAYKNSDGTGGIVRMKSSYSYRNITVRNTYYNGTSVTAGPAVSTTYPIGYFREDYQYTATSTSTPDYLDEHNGRFCVTPEYPNGIYCYFTTVTSNWNSAYPYAIGPTFYGVYANRKVTSITETVTTYPVNTTPSIYIAASAKSITYGTLVSFTSAIYNGGIAPSYQWKKNGVNDGTNTNTYSSSNLVNGDSITCVLTVASSTATSNAISMLVAGAAPTISIGASASSVCAGTSVTYNATTTNGGTNPTYQWKKNGINVGTSSTTYVDNGLLNNDSISCVISITSGASATSNSISITITPNTNNNTTVAACGSYTWPVNGQTYLSGGTYTSTSGCHTEVLQLTISCSLTLNLKLFIEGYYIGNNIMRSVKFNQDSTSPLTDVENITVELHHATTYATLYTTTATLKTDGTAVCTFSTVPTGSYYIVIKNSNAVQTWSATPQTIGTIPLTYDFSTAANKAYNDNMIFLSDGVFGFYSGDINKDDVIDGSDATDLDLDISNSEFGVKITDLNGDGSVDGSDATYFVNNQSNSVFANYPQ